MNKAVLSTLSVLALAGAQHLSATLLVDRGLPTANLNNVNGSSRANVAWAFGSDSTGSWLTGDTFKNTASANYYIDTIRVWTVGGSTSGLQLWGGLDGSTGSAIGLISSTYAIAPTTYSGGASYQGYSGSFIQMYEVDFAVNVTLAAGQSYDFFVGGTGSDYTFAHASNHALSGSPQDGADDQMLYIAVNGGSAVDGTLGTWSSATPGWGWDKASDINVQVVGTVPDAASTLGMMGFALASLGSLSRKLRKS
jgi:hypothetical protein